MRRAGRAVALAAAIASGICLASAPVHAGVSDPASAEAPAAIFALIVGVNRGVDPTLKPLLYADDDAARYQILFHALGARTVLLTRPDANTARVAPEAVRDATPPSHEALLRAVGQIALEVEEARARGRRPVFYFLFAGHGNVDEGRAYLALEDARLTGDDLDRTVLRAIGADESHVIIDACYSYLLAHERGPGGRTRAVQGFSHTGGGLDRPDVGLLLSTSSARESHEWDGFQAGVFSHEVRSGLHGAADIDGDGQIDYREIAAFVDRANAAIPNDRLRPDLFARPPAGQSRLLDLRAARERSLLVDAQVQEGHYFLEDRAGNRLVEFHSAAHKNVRLVRAGDQALFLFNVGTGTEYEIASTAGETRLGSIAPRPAPARPRGAAQHAFSLIFSLPFDDAAVTQYRFPAPTAETVLAAQPEPAPIPRWRRLAASGAVGAAGLFALASGALVITSRQDASRAQGASQTRAAELNLGIETDRRRALWLGGASAAALAAGLGLWLWPTAAVEPQVVAGAGGVTGFGLGGRF